MDKKKLKQVIGYMKEINQYLAIHEEDDGEAKDIADQIFDEMLAEIESTEVRLV